MTARRLTGASGGSAHGLHRFVRLLAKVQRTDDATSCWLWTGSRSQHGYGRLSTNDPGQPKRLEQAHRVAYEMAFGPIPAGCVVRHRCDTPLCCRPSHLEIGSQADNVRDMVECGRARGGVHVGASHPNAKLTDEDVAHIRAARAARLTYRAIGASYGISTSQVARICAGTAWKQPAVTS